MKSLNGKGAWITGAGSGIGLAGAQAQAQAGATIRFVAELQAHVCINRLVISPNWSLMYTDNP